MLFDHENEYGSQWEAILSIASKIGCAPETLRKWVRRTEVDTGRRGGVTSDERARIKDLEAKSARFIRSRQLFRILHGLLRAV